MYIVYVSYCKYKTAILRSFCVFILLVLFQNVGWNLFWNLELFELTSYRRSRLCPQFRQLPAWLRLWGEIRLLTQLTQNTKRKQEKWKTEPNTLLFSKYKCFLPSENTITTISFLTKYMQWQKLDPTVKCAKIFGKLLFQYYGIATLVSDDTIHP